MDFMHNLCIGNNRCWFFDDNTRSIYSLNLNTDELKLEVMLDLYSSPYYDSYFSDIVYFEEKVILIPGREEHIYIYDTKESVISYVEIRQSAKKNFKSIYAFINGIVMGRYLYLIPYIYPDCVRLNFDDMSVDYFPFENYFKCTIGMYGRGVKINDREIALLSRENNGIEFYDIVDNKFERFFVGNKNNIYKDICFDGRLYWLTDNAGNLIKWDRAMNFSKKVFNYCENKIPTIGNRQPLNERKIHVCGNSIWLFDYDYLPVKINLENNHWEIINNLVFGDCDLKRYNLVFSYEKEGCFILYAMGIDSIVIFDIKSNNKKLISLQATKQTGNDILSKYIEMVCKGDKI